MTLIFSEKCPPNFSFKDSNLIDQEENSSFIPSLKAGDYCSSLAFNLIFPDKWSLGRIYIEMLVCDVTRRFGTSCFLLN